MLIRFLLLLLFAPLTFSQITWEPDFPTEFDSITVFFDASQGSKGLMGYAGDVYAHTGVITSLSSSGSDWKYVKTSWGQNTPETKLERIGTNLYRYKIKPSVRNFYGVPSSEKILNVAFVFRSASQVGGSYLEGKTSSGGDIFLPISEEGLNVSIISPAITPYFASLNDTINIQVVAAHSNNLSLFINDSLAASTTGTSLIHNIIASGYGKKKIKVVATGIDNQTKSDSTYFIVNTPVAIEPVPSGMKYGINYISSTSVILNLFAPLKQFVYVIGDFTNWEIDPEYYMKRSPDQTKYWIQINGLEPGKEYIFQYLVDGSILIADPYTQKTSDPWNDKFISNQVYPDLIPYPEGKTSEVAAVLQTDEPEYEWKITNFEKPKKTDLVIYELLLRDFLAEHNYNALADTLGYLKRLGVNAIELMPVMEFEGNESWGYNSSFHFAPDKYYGTKNDLKKFIDKAHEEGFAVILDIVLNHLFGQSPMVRMWWDSANNRPSADNPFFNQVAKHDFNVGYDFNHESNATKFYTENVVEFWIKEYNIDGYRFDLSKGFTQKNTLGNVGLWGQYDQSRINIWKNIADRIWSIDSTFYVILEHFADNSEELVLSNYGMMLWGNLNHNYNEATMGYIPGSNFSGVSYKQRGWQNPHLVGYMESHDEERLMYRNLQFGNSSGTYNIKNLQTALQRNKLAAAFYFTVPGPKMIWQFGEVGYDLSIDFNGRLGNKPIRWYYYNELGRQKLYKTFAALTALKQHDAFESNNFNLSAGSSVKTLSIRDSSMDVYVIGNFDVTSKTASHNFSKTGYWYNYFSGDSILVIDSIAQVTLAPGEFFVYTTDRLPAPEPDILTDIDNDSEGKLVTGYLLEQNYPNPFNPVTSIRYAVSHSSFITLKVYDLLGNEIAVLVNEEKPEGIYQVEFNASHLASSIYFYTLETGNFRQTKKMTLIK